MFLIYDCVSWCVVLFEIESVKLLVEVVIGSFCIFSEFEDFSMVVVGELFVVVDFIIELIVIEFDYFRVFEVDSVGIVWW